jgi:Holliday junction resolvasome RuvABC ATP-dependent DNA helicase subunit
VPRTSDDALKDTVDGFVDELAPVLERAASRVSTINVETLRRDVVVEAFNLATAFIDSDGLHTDDELLNLLIAFGPRLETVAQCRNLGDLRNSGLVADKRRFLEKPSTFFDLLVSIDARELSAHAWRYYELAVRIAHTVASLDDHVAHSELQSIDRYRTMLLRSIELAGLPRPGVDRARKLGGTPGDPTPTATPTRARRGVDPLLAELDALIGLAAVKAEVRLVVNLLQIQRLRRKRNLPVVEGSRHLVFTGNPGTGKTTVARLLAELYWELEVVDQGQLVETDRSGLVAGYVGQTAIKVTEVFTTALGGVLLIDEAYALAQGGESDFGQEAIATLVKLIEDHRDDVVVIAAGYPEEMDDFIESNPGLRSRFTKTIHFADYTDAELVQIFESLCAKSKYLCDAAARTKLQAVFASQERGRGFGNGRFARNLFEDAVARQASRLVKVENPSDEQLLTLTVDDIVAPSTRHS